MKSRLIWTAVLVAAIAGFYYATIRPAIRTPEPVPDRRRVNRDFKAFQPPPIPPPPLPEVKIPELILPPPAAARRNDPVPGPLEVPIQNGATIDFSTGAPHVRMQGKDKEALDRALRDIAEATKEVTFPPRK
jgi:hypothetical protein